MDKHEQPRTKQAVTPEELEEQEVIELPDREAMTILSGAFADPSHFLPFDPRNAGPIKPA
ncbi:MAG: hypothetical protein NVSMB42_08100 [Herpetosiphon sp.]